MIVVGKFCLLKHFKEGCDGHSRLLPCSQHMLCFCWEVQQYLRKETQVAKFKAKKSRQISRRKAQPESERPVSKDTPGIKMVRVISGRP